jgi:hypothetical protein
MFIFVVPTLLKTLCVGKVAETITRTARLTPNVDESWVICVIPNNVLYDGG